MDKVVSHASVGGSICVFIRWASSAVIWDLGFSVRLHDLLFPYFVSDTIYSPLFPLLRFDLVTSVYTSSPHYCAWHGAAPASGGQERRTTPTVETSVRPVAGPPVHRLAQGRRAAPRPASDRGRSLRWRSAADRRAAPMLATAAGGGAGERGFAFGFGFGFGAAFPSPRRALSFVVRP